ncbi:21897_t:CDS:2, partial [Cetraspora pellucida]
LQSFAIPGSVMLSVLGGTLWGSWKALLLVCFVSSYIIDCSATGATICSLLSYYLGQAVTERFFSERMEIWNEQEASIFIYHIPSGNAVFAELTINFILINELIKGVAPLSFIHTQAGDTIHQLSETDEISFFTTKNIIAMIFIAIAALIPVLMRKRFEKKEMKEKL